jgi:hypothetical protein
MVQSPVLAFRSLAFAAAAGEDEATNPGIFGKALANWLGEALRSQKVPAGEVIAEDFGWCLRVGAKPDRFYVACASDPEQRGRWQVFVFQDRGMLAGIFGKGGRSEAVDTLYATVRNVLTAAPEVLDLRSEP